MIIVDTSIIVDILQGNKRMGDFLAELKTELSVSSVVLAEILIGFYRHSKNVREKLKENFGKIIKDNNIKIISFDENIADKYAELQAHLLKKGMVFSPFDGIIAATALFHGITLLTSDEDFKRVKGLKLLFPS